MPKYLVNSTGDQFFAPDSSQFYFDDLLGQNYLRYVPNTGHSLNSDALEVNNAVAQGLTLPEFSWTVSAVVRRDVFRFLLADAYACSFGSTELGR